RAARRAPRRRVRAPRYRFPIIEMGADSFIYPAPSIREGPRLILLRATSFGIAHPRHSRHHKNPKFSKPPQNPWNFPQQPARQGDKALIRIPKPRFTSSNLLKIQAKSSH
ncbi:hypothetical protein, partial [Burkholderia sp. Cy-637]|uniref:hypothetical protein n=1 Tax=Burkholderia sp. Cy-637 TaxID=2608327 RepID=UPI00196447BC